MRERTRAKSAVACGPQGAERYAERGWSQSMPTERMVLSRSQRCSVQRRVRGPECCADFAPGFASAARAAPVTAPVTAVAAGLAPRGPGAKPGGGWGLAEAPPPF